MRRKWLTLIVVALLAAVSASILIWQQNPKAVYSTRVLVSAGAPLLAPQFNLPEQEPSSLEPAVETGEPALDPLLVHVVDAVGAPVSEAQISWIEPNHRDLAGITNSFGGATVARRGNDATRGLLVEATRFAPALKNGAELGGKEVTVVLSTAFPIVGTVRWFNNENVPMTEPGYVIGWPSDYPMSTDLLRSISQRSWPPIVAASISTTGVFELPVESGNDYIVRAAVDGCLEETALTVAAGSNVSLLISPLYGALVTIEEAGGAPLRAYPGSWGPRGGNFGAEGDTNATPVIPTILELALAGLDVSALATNEWDRQLHLATSTDRVSSIGLFAVTADIPGYEPARATMSLNRITTAIPSYTMSLVPVVAQFGTVAVSFVVGSEYEGNGWPIANLHLEGEGRQVNLPVRDTMAHNFDGVPEGQYTCSLQFAHGFASVRSAPEQIIVQRGSVSRIAFDLSAYASVAVSVVRRDGEAYAGPMTLQIDQLLPSDGKKGRGRRSYTSFSGQPYRVDGLPEGEYSIRMQSPYAAKCNLDHFTAAPNILQEITLGPGS